MQELSRPAHVGFIRRETDASTDGRAVSLARGIEQRASCAARHGASARAFCHRRRSGGRHAPATCIV